MTDETKPYFYATLITSAMVFALCMILVAWSGWFPEARVTATVPVVLADSPAPDPWLHSCEVAQKRAKRNARRWRLQAEGCHREWGLMYEQLYRHPKCPTGAPSRWRR